MFGRLDFEAVALVEFYRLFVVGEHEQLEAVERELVVRAVCYAREELFAYAALLAAAVYHDCDEAAVRAALFPVREHDGEADGFPVFDGDEASVSFAERAQEVLRHRNPLARKAKHAFAHAVLPSYLSYCLGIADCYRSYFHAGTSRNRLFK